MRYVDSLKVFQEEEFQQVYAENKIIQVFQDYIKVIQEEFQQVYEENKLIQVFLDYIKVIQEEFQQVFLVIYSFLL